MMRFFEILSFLLAWGYSEILSSSPQKCGAESYSVSGLWLFG